MQTPAHPALLTRLAYAALAPFALLTALLWVVNARAHPYVATALLMYGAVIVSFVAGLQWGLVFKGDGRATRADLLSGTGFGLLAWIAALMPPYAGLPLLAMLIVGGYVVDRKTWPQQGLSSWMTLRFRFTALSCLCCLLAAGAT